MHYFSLGGKDLLHPTDGGHWHTLMSRCQPCRIRYDHVARVESMEQDVHYIVHNKLRGRGATVKRNVHGETTAKSTTNSSSFVTRHEEYVSISGRVFDAIRKRYSEDMDVYGYNFTRSANGHVTATCSAGLNDGQTCC